MTIIKIMPATSRNAKISLYVNGGLGAFEIKKVNPFFGDTFYCFTTMNASSFSQEAIDSYETANTLEEAKVRIDKLAAIKIRTGLEGKALKEEEERLVEQERKKVIAEAFAKSEHKRKAAEAKKQAVELEAQQFALSRKALLVHFYRKDQQLIRDALFIATTHEKYTNPSYKLMQDPHALSDLTVAEMGEVKKIYELLESQN